MLKGASEAFEDCLDEVVRFVGVEDFDVQRQAGLLDEATEEFDPRALVGHTLGGAYTVTEVLGSGSFGCVLAARDIRTGGRLAIKMERRDAAVPQLEIEHRVLQELRTARLHRGIPDVYGLFELDCSEWVGRDGQVFTCLAMQYLGTTSLQVLQDGGEVMSEQCLQDLGAQCLERLRCVHRAGFVHRDVKPENFMLWKGSVYLIDYGLAKRVVDPDTGEHEEYERKAPCGTPRYMSRHAHANVMQTRRDDLEAFVYMMVSLCKGRLPWQHMPLEELPELKNNTPDERLCAGTPSYYAATLQYVRGLRFTDMPDYGLLYSWWAPAVTVSESR